MAEGFEPFHVPQQSRRDKLRVVVSDQPSCEQAAATLQGCSALLSLYNPSLLSSAMLATAGAATSGDDFRHQNQSSVSVVKEEGVNMMGFLGGFMNASSSSSSSSHHPYLDPQPSLAVYPSSINSNNPFLYTAQNLRDFEQSTFRDGDQVVLFKPESLPSTSQGLSLSLSSHHHTNQLNLPLELNLQRYESTVSDQKGIEGIVFRGGSTLNDVARSSVPLGPFTGYASILKRSSFLKPAQLLLQEFCDVGRAIYAERSCDDSCVMDPSLENMNGTRIADSPELCKKKTRLISMLDEVYRKYKQYYQQMQAVVASFESVAGLASAAPYISLAFKAMSKHFRSLKNAITDQLQFTSNTHGNGNLGNDETPRIGTGDRSFHSQRQVHGSGFFENQPVWRPQRGLPEHAVAVLRAWLFEHFLHPYPTDSDKQMLAKQTGLSRSQVSNWFINARVRLWKPMVEEIHMLETRQAQKAAAEQRDQNVDESNGCQPSANPFRCDEQLQNTSTRASQDPPSKRSRNDDLTHIPDRNDEQMNFSYGDLSSHPNVGVGLSTAGGSSTVSLTLGLQQNNGIGISESFPLNLVHRFGLEANSEAYVMGGF